MYNCIQGHNSVCAARARALVRDNNDTHSCGPSVRATQQVLFVQLSSQRVTLIGFNAMIGFRLP